MSRQYFEDYCDRKNIIPMPKQKFVAEHKKLVGVLKRGDPRELKAEAREQSRELAEQMKNGSGNAIRRMLGRNQVAPAPPPPRVRVVVPRDEPRRGSVENRRMAEALGEDERPRPVMRRQNAVRRGTDSSASTINLEEEEEDPSPRPASRPASARRASDPAFTRPELEERAFESLSRGQPRHLHDDIRRMIRRMSLRELRRAFS